MDISPNKAPADTEGDDEDEDDGDEDIDWSPNRRQVARGSSQGDYPKQTPPPPKPTFLPPFPAAVNMDFRRLAANPVVIEDDEADLDLEAEDDEAGDKASGCAEPLELGMRFALI